MHSIVTDVAMLAVEDDAVETRQGNNLGLRTEGIDTKVINGYWPALILFNSRSRGLSILVVWAVG